MAGQSWTDDPITAGQNRIRKKQFILQNYKMLLIRGKMLIL